MREPTTITAPTDQKVLIVGLGKTGLSCARYLSSRGVPVAITDTRENPPGLEQLHRELPDVAIFLGGFDETAFAAADLLVVSPGVPVSHPLIQAAMGRGIEVVGDIELFARHACAPIAAITGSNGKSTVTTLLWEMARAAGLQALAGGNLGQPVLDIISRDADLYILELSSFQLETTYTLTPKVATVLNIAPDHMDRYATLQDYADAKATLYWRASSRVMNRDDELVMAMPQGEGDDWYFSLHETAPRTFGIDRRDGVDWLCFEQSELMPVSRLKLAGRHNHANVLAALAMGHALDLPMQVMLETAADFTGLAHRTQYVAEHQAVRWYNDSKGTNVGATVAALRGLDDGSDARTVLIAGGQSKGADFSPLADVVVDTARAVVLIGEAAAELAHALNGKAPVKQAADMDEAVTAAAALARSGDRVLLSPACASFDMFDNYEQRGEQFMDAVERLIR